MSNEDNGTDHNQDEIKATLKPAGRSGGRPPGAKNKPGGKKTGPKPERRQVTAEFDVVLVGRDKKPIRPQEVHRLAALGCKDIEIANWLGVDGNTLRYNFGAELVTGRELLRQKLRHAQIQTAIGGNAALLIWLGKQFLNQTESGASNDENTILPWSADE